MENLYLSLPNLLTATKRRAAAFAIAVIALLPFKLFGQAPTISYSGPQTYTTYVAVSPLAPTASGAAAPTGAFGTPVVLGSGLTFNVNGLAVDAAGNIYVNDQEGGSGLVKKISADGSSTTTIASGFLSQSANVAVDGAGNVYVADQSSVWKIPASGSPVTYGTPVTIGSFSRPFGIAVDAPGNIYVADLNAGVYKMANDGSNKVKIDNGISSPSAVAVDAAGNVYAVTISDLALYKIPANGSPQVQLASGFAFPRGLAVDAAGTVYVDDEGQQGIYAVPAGGGTQVAAVSGLSNLVGVAVDANYNLYGTLQGTGGISKFSPTGGYFVSPALPAGLSLDNTTGIISGTPTQTVTATDYLVSAYNAVGGGSATVNITVNGNAGLSNFITSQGSLSPSFSPATTSYTTSVDNAVTSITVTPVTIDPDATVTVNGTTVVSGSASGNLPLSVGPNTITTIVTGAGGVATKTYTLTVTRAPSANADLSNLATNAGALTPGFANAVISYTLSVGNAVTSIAITPTTADTTAVVTVNGTTVVSGSASGSLHLSVGNNTITTIVTAQDGTTTKTYTLTVSRAPSTNADLSNLTTNAGALTPGFANATTAYSVSVPNNISQIAVTPTTADADATITVNGTAVATGNLSGAIALSVGANAITIVVTASDNSSTKTYTITVTRAQSSNAQLSSAGIGYTTDGSGNTYAIVTPIVAGVGATVTVNGTIVVSGAPSSPILLSPGSNTVVITVTAQNGVTKLTYKITVMGPLSGISTLSGLTISAGTLSGAFSSNTTNYTDQVNGAVTSVTVTPTTTDPNATVTVNGAAVNSGTASGSIGLPVGDTAIPTVVTAQDGVTTTTYTITVTRLSNDAGLSALSTSSGTLNPVFATGTTAYTELVSTAITAITLTPITNYAGATVKVNGNTVTSGTASASIPLNIGANIINTVVTAQDGTTQTYTVTVNRLSNDASLSALTISRGTLTPGFATNTTAYADTVSNATTAVTITPTVNNASATILVNGIAVTSGTPSASQALVAGTNVITATVTAQDGVTTMSYTVTVVRLPNMPTDASLTGLSVSNGTLTPAFASATTAYKDTVSNATTSITVTPTISNVGETVKVNGVTVNPGTASGSIALSSGNTTITTVVTAADGVTKKTYTVIVNRISNNAYLSNLAPSSGILSPDFAAATGSYTASVSNATFSITVTPTVNNPNATVKVNGALVSSGSASAAIPLVVGANTITAAVTAQDGVTKKTYTVVVTRAVGDATLSNLTLSSGTLSPVFVAGTVSYTASVTNATASITVTPTVNNPNATVQVNGTAVNSGTASAAIPLALGANTVTVLVTALDGVTTKSYTLTITRALGDVDLTNVVLSSGTLSPVYFAGTTSYTALVTNATTSITVTPTANNPASTIKVNNVVTTSGTASAPIALAVGNTTINMIVTAPDGVTHKTFAIVVTRPSNNAYLTSLTISSGTLSPAFVNTTSAYTTTVSNATTSVTVTPTLNNPHATITVNGTAIASGATSQAIPLAVGNTTINTVVIAQDGVTKKNYTITVTRPSNNAYLSNLTISSGTLSPVFAQATGGYTASVSNATATVTITPTLANPHGAITVNGTTVATGAASSAIPLNVGSNTITVAVTAQDGVTHKTYTITVTRASGSLNSLYLPGSGQQTPLVSSLNEKVEANNILSPNGDGINDIWVVKNIAFYPDNTVTVYDRAGKVVFTKKGYTNDWNGAYRGSVLSEGTYYYLVDLGNGSTMKGFITVVSH